MCLWKFQAGFSEWDNVSGQIMDALAQRQSDASDIRKIMMALEELVPNIIMYGARDRCVQVELKLASRRETTDNSIAMILEDDGIPFNPLEYAEHNVITSAEHPAGGWGIDMARHLMDKLVYQYADGKNRLYLEKVKGVENNVSDESNREKRRNCVGD